jgi:5-methylthioadenosine/S-adenosylhomocysteine deaminase
MTEKTDLLIDARWIATVSPAHLLEHHSVAVRDGRIHAILPSHEAHSRYQPDEHVRLPHHLLMPGLINLHTHAAMSLMRGIADDLPLMRWLQEHIWPAEAKLVSPEFVRDGTELACLEMLRGGTTCFSDMYFHPEAAAEGVIRSGLRAALGIVTLDFPTGYASDATDYLEKGLAAREKYLEHPRLRFMLAPHAPYTVGDETFERLTTIAGQLDLGIHIHIHETADEVETSLRQHGSRPLTRLRQLGVLGPGTVGVHATQLNQQEIDMLAAHGCSIAHCPTSNMKLASGATPVMALLAAGINVGLGTDGAASNNRLDMFQEMRHAALLAKHTNGDATALPAAQVLQMATLNGARALGLEHEIGSIENGKQADLVAVDFDHPELMPCFDPISHLVYAAGREHVSHVWISGKCHIADSKTLCFDQARLKTSLALWQNRSEFR